MIYIDLPSESEKVIQLATKLKMNGWIFIQGWEKNKILLGVLRKKKNTYQYQEDQKQQKTKYKNQENIILTFHSHLNNEKYSYLENIVESYFVSLVVASKQNFQENRKPSDRPGKDERTRWDTKIISWNEKGPKYKKSFEVI